MRNWKTSAAGLLAAVGMIAPILSKYLDGDALGNEDVALILGGIGVLIKGILSMDARKESKDEAAKPGGPAV